MKTKTLLLLLSVIFFNISLFGATYTVVNTDESGEGSLAWAIESVIDANDVIQFNVDANELALASVINKSMTIDGYNEFTGSNITLKRSASKNFITIAGEIFTLKNIVLDGEDASGGIGITSDNASTLNIENCILKNINSGGGANNGGAIRAQGVLNVTNTVFENNTQGTGTYGGGAISIYNAANVTIENSSFIGNKAARGAGIHAHGTAATGYNVKIINSTFANNEAIGGADGRGGALYFSCPTSTEANVTIINCTITGNSALNNGGGICAFASANKKININLINSIVAYNMSAGNKYSDVDVWNLSDRVFFPQATNCLYGAALGTAAGISWTNSINPADMATATIFRLTESWTGSFIRPAIESTQGLKIVRIDNSSPARGTGAASVSGFDIPTKDQVGNDRKNQPSMGAVEFMILSSVPTNQSQGIQLITEKNAITFKGLSKSELVSVYSITGSLLHQAVVANNETITLDNNKTQLVIVRIQNKGHKLILR